MPWSGLHPKTCRHKCLSDDEMAFRRNIQPRGVAGNAGKSCFFTASLEAYIIFTPLFPSPGSSTSSVRSRFRLILAQVLEWQRGAREPPPSRPRSSGERRSASEQGSGVTQRVGLDSEGGPHTAGRISFTPPLPSSLSLTSHHRRHS